MRSQWNCFCTSKGTLLFCLTCCQYSMSYWFLTIWLVSTVLTDSYSFGKQSCATWTTDIVGLGSVKKFVLSFNFVVHVPRFPWVLCLLVSLLSSWTTPSHFFPWLSCVSRSQEARKIGGESKHGGLYYFAIAESIFYCSPVFSFSLAASLLSWSSISSKPLTPSSIIWSYYCFTMWSMQLVNITVFPFPL